MIRKAYGGDSHGAHPGPHHPPQPAHAPSHGRSHPHPSIPDPDPLVPTVVVEAYLVSVRDAAAPGEQGLLRPLLQRWQLGSCGVGAFGLPAVQAVVSYKWERYARRLLLQQLLTYSVWLLGFTGFLLLFNSSDAEITDEQLLSTWQGRAAVFCEALALLGMLPFVAGEASMLRAYGLGSWLTAWNLLDVGTYVLQVAVTVLHLGVFHNGPTWLVLAAATQAVLLVVRLTYFSRVFRSTTFDFMSSLQVVGREVAWYVALLLLLMWGFACSFYTLFRTDDKVDGFESLPLSLVTMLNYAIGGTSYYMRGFTSSAYPGAAVALCMAYQFLVSMLLMSMLTGVMTNALMRASSQEALGMVLNRAQVIDELETVLAKPLLTRLGSTHFSPGHAATPCSACEVWLPYIHVLRVNPRSLESIDGEAQLWPSAMAAGGGGGGGGVAGGSTTSLSDLAGGSGELQSASVARLESSVRRLEAQLSDVAGTVRQLLAVNEALTKQLGAAQGAK
ncbi:hypothetical protein HYH03_009625 [Edaphochlamys debaryana]|uniref:Ion transport domain-containing protein n=1 Tax=Edaphochlamys debaryana TaxID=47281 RepID=A0A835XYK0_9CHLO|nr:hypothetical protein HYH03_009625 [Edaphochlamys debaryana]|eukprot:KAG2492134.1 hypothetical protein HYH03_009625 [Edaphochlamys debaryana]